MPVVGAGVCGTTAPGVAGAGAGGSTCGNCAWPACNRRRVDSPFDSETKMASETTMALNILLVVLRQPREKE